jgi:hypothetical protein
LGAIERKPFGNLSLEEIMHDGIYFGYSCLLRGAIITPVTSGQTVVTASQANGAWESKRGEFKGSNSRVSMNMYRRLAGW